MVMPTITVDERQLKELNDLLGDMPKEVDKITRRAINYATRSVRTQMVKRVAKHIGMKQKTIRGRAWQNKAKLRLVGSVRAGKFGWPFGKLSHRQTKQGVSVKLYGKRRLIPGAFIAKVGDHEGVFVRKGRKRLPIREPRTPSLTRIITEMNLTPELVTLGEKSVTKEMTRLVTLALARRAAAETEND